jgi:hypothetical protein
MAVHKPTETSEAAIARRLDVYLEEGAAIRYWWNTSAADLASGSAILALDREQQPMAVRLSAQRLLSVLSTRTPAWPGASLLGIDAASAHYLMSLLSALLQSNQALEGCDLEHLIAGIVSSGQSTYISVRLDADLLAGLLRAIESYAENAAISEVHGRGLQELLNTRLLRGKTAESRKLRNRLLSLIATGEQNQQWPIEAGEPWADQALRDVSAFDGQCREAWHALLVHAKTASGSKPSARWLKMAHELAERAEKAHFLELLGSWFARVGQPGEGRPMRGYVGVVLNPTVISEPNTDLLKGLSWCAAAAGDPSASRMLGDLADVSFKKIPVHGARCPRVGNACLVALNLLPGHQPVGELTRLRSRVKQPSVRAAVEKAISKAAENLGMSREEVEEISTPSYGLRSDGTLRRSVGSFLAELTIVGTRDVEIRWTGSNGKTVKSVPAEVKHNHADALKDLQRIRKDIEKSLPAQAQRIERLLVDQRDWPPDAWQERYLEHPLLGQLCRRLIWQLVDSPAVQFIWFNKALVGSDDNAVDLPAGSRVRLWHSIGSTPAEIQRWRGFLEHHGVTQPFKQAHRELYILTDAEERTVTYSNRFAAHVLRQHQFSALCQARGWQYRLMGDFDSHNRPTLNLPRYELRAEFWVEQPDNDELSSAGINLRITTDQVRFYRADANEPMPLAQVPPLLFSEIMRDVDLFVGVASVGNDPNWQDGGPDGRFRAYWHDFSFGTLNATAQTRRAVLESLLPRLTKIRDRCRLSDRFLIVRGDIRTYKIHLGSGNILMEPNDQYLCIVPSRSSNDTTDVFLPFEGDATLSVILSKAFLLAEDKKIKDTTITRQIAN